MSHEEKIQEMVKRGGKRWTAYGKDRVYFALPFSAYGLSVSFMGSGNVKSASLDGCEISNSSGRYYVERARGAKIFYDAKKDEMIFEGLKDWEDKAREYIENLLS